MNKKEEIYIMEGSEAMRILIESFNLPDLRYTEIQIKANVHAEACIECKFIIESQER